MHLHVPRGFVTELCLQAGNVHQDPYNQVELEATFKRPDGTSLTVPAFWAGDDLWKIRFSSLQEGEHSFQTVCTEGNDAQLDDVKGQVTVHPYTGDDRLACHGRLCVNPQKTHFEHEDGTPFFWMGDTWWMGLSQRCGWPEGFQKLTRDRADKGFNVVQIIVGPYPDMEAWDPRGRSEGGFPFEEGFERIHLDHFDAADLKIAHLVRQGIVPCIVGMWGYYLPQIGVDKIKRFWRYVAARYGAYPVVWCVCGEGTMPYYLSETKEKDAATQKKGWTEVMAYLREIDGYHNLITIHPTRFGTEQVEDPSLMDFEMLQTGHGDLESVKNTIESVRIAVEREPRMPVINAEVNYEGILGRAWQNVQRLCFYHSVLNGLAGYTYGANGIWQMSSVEQPYGPSPHGRCWGDTPWEEAAQLPGGRQVALGAAFLRRFPWWKIKHHPEWVAGDPQGASAYEMLSVGIPGELRLVYCPHCWDPPTLRCDVQEQRAFREAFYFDPCTGREIPLGTPQWNDEGEWTPPFPPECHDWILAVR